jgi:adenylyltransferase/sulfurtransferase
VTGSREIVIQKRDRYSRLRAIEWWDQARLQQARVLVAGVGALGNEVLKNLALVGVGYILVVDFDTIEVTNLSRSILFRPGDESQSKATLAARRLREINPDIQVEALEGDVVWDIGLGTLRRFDAVIGCLDNREARLGLNRNCWKVGVPWIDGALGVMSGQVRIFVPPDSACYECGFTPQDYQELNMRYSCQLLMQEGALSGQVPTTPGSASIIAAMQVQELLKMLHGQPVLAGHEMEYDGQHHIYRVTRLARREDCLSHDPIPLDQVVSLPDARASEITGGQLLQRVRADLGERAYVLLDREVVTALICPNGHGVDRQVRPQHLTGVQAARCPQCGKERIASFTHKITHNANALTDLPLATLGVPPGHILLGRYGRNQGYYELGGDLPVSQPESNSERS